MSNPKLMFREGQWVVVQMPEPSLYTSGIITDPLATYEKAVQLAIAEAKPVAPQDQERVKWFVWNDGKEIPLVEDTDFKNWVPNSSKLYDCGDLEFEFKWIRIKSKSLDLVAESKQFWVIVEKAKEFESPAKNAITLKEIEEIISLSEETKEIDYDECPECGAPTEYWSDEYVRKLQSRVRELEEEDGYKIIKGDEVNSFLAAIIRRLNTEQTIVLRDALIERTPKEELESNDSQDNFELLREYVGSSDSERWQLARKRFKILRIK